MQWTNSSTSQAWRDSKKYEIVNAFYPGRFKDYYHYEQTSNFFSEASRARGRARRMRV